MKKGIRGHDVKAEGLCNIAKVMRKCGMEYIQLVLERSVKDFTLGSYSEDFAKMIKDELGDVKIAILGSYINPAATDEKILAGEIEKFKEKIRFATVLKPLAVGTETGFFGPVMSDEANNSEQAYIHVLKVLCEIAAYAAERGVNIAVEGVGCFVINSPRKMHRLINDIPYDNVKVIFDPVNYINANNYLHQDEIINETFDLLSERLVAIHAKDFVPTENGGIDFPAPGKGLLNYKLIFENMKKYGVDVPIIMEGVDEVCAAESFERLEKIKASV